MTDRELLELACNAAGLICGTVSDAGVLMMFSGKDYVWNPLTDDGDALRLLIACGFEIILRHEQAGVEIFCPSFKATKTLASIPFSEFAGDKFLTTRIAIVRAAASLGREGGNHG